MIAKRILLTIASFVVATSGCDDTSQPSARGAAFDPLVVCSPDGAACVGCDSSSGRTVCELCVAHSDECVAAELVWSDPPTDARACLGRWCFACSGDLDHEGNGTPHAFHCQLITPYGKCGGGCGPNGCTAGCWQ